MLVQIMKGKIHNAVVTDAQLDYVGSITIDESLMKGAGMYKGEKVLVVNNNNGARIETYVIVGNPGSGIICLNGAAARHFHKGDGVIIIAFGIMEEKKVAKFKPKVIFPNANNVGFKTADTVLRDDIRNKVETSVSVTRKTLMEVALQFGYTNDEVIKIHSEISKDIKHVEQRNE